MSESLIQLAIQLTRIFVPIIIVVGVVINVLNIIIHTRSDLIQHACCLYFVVWAITIFYSSSLLIFNLLPDGYQLDPTKYLTIFCKIIGYLLNLCPTLSVYFIVLASTNRYCSSSINVQRRNLKNLRVARQAIGIIVTVFAIFFIGTLIVFYILLYHFV
jgi:hypothetical protein